MNIYTAEFYGHYLGGYALIFAVSEDHARELLAVALDTEGLAPKQKELPAITLRGRAVASTKPQGVILWNGDY